MSVRARLPWQAKILAKVVLSRLPIGYDSWRRLGLFRDGRMDDPGYAFEVFWRHFKWYETGDLKGKTVLELGPGDSIGSGIISSAYGAAHTYLVDGVDHAVKDPRRYLPLIDLLESKGLPVEGLRNATSFAELLQRARTTYLASGLDSLRRVPSDSVDFAFSNAVLEHVRLREFDGVMAELRRTLSPDGLSSHEVDLKDHLSEGLNNLRVPERVWESRLFSESGFYTNRIRYDDMIRRFESAGFRVQVVQETRWEKLPMRVPALRPEYRELAEEDLLVQAFDVLLRRD